MPIFYLRLLKCQIEYGRNKASSDAHLGLVLTVVTDLGELSYPEPLSIRATVQLQGQNQLAASLLQWTGYQAVQKFTLEVNTKGLGINQHKSLFDKAVLELVPISYETKATSLSPVWSSNCFELSTSLNNHVLGLTCPDLSNFANARCTVRRLANGLSMRESSKESIVAHSKHITHDWILRGSYPLVWDAGLICATLIMEEEPCTQFGKALRHVLNSSMSILELGTGIGLTGVAIAKAFSHLSIVVTDLTDAEELVTRNILDNGCLQSVAFRRLDWTQPVPETIRTKKYDVIVMTDVTYNESYHEALLNTLATVLQPDTKMLFASKYRHSRYVWMDRCSYTKLTI